MYALSPQQLLDIWEQGQGQSSTQRALALIAAFDPETHPITLAKLSLGQRDACLFSVREYLFGTAMPCQVICPVCDERLELMLQTRDLNSDPTNHSATELTIEQAAYRVCFRLPDSTDLLAISYSKSANSAQKTLLKRCILDARRNGKKARLDRLPKYVIKALAAKMDEFDPQANIQLELTCPACEHKWLSIFDILSFLWSEIETWVKQILMEVDILASKYGWSEIEILNLSPRRRKIYLEMALG